MRRACPTYAERVRLNAPDPVSPSVDPLPPPAVVSTPVAPPLDMTSSSTLVNAAANAPVTAQQALQSKAALAKMKRSLTGWLKFRAINDQIAAGAPVPTALLKHPRSGPPNPTLVAAAIAKRPDTEAVLATQLHALLSEVFDSSTLPDPNLQVNPKAAVQLATIAISGQLPGAAPTPAPAGMAWMWPMVIIVGAIAFVITTQIRSSADVAKQAEHDACIQSGACTDYGFWLKFGAITVGAWIIWDKFGVGERVKTWKRRT